MESLEKLKKIAIQDEPNNVQAIFADDTSVSNIIQTSLAFIAFFLILLTLCIFAPRESEVVCTKLSLEPNTEHSDIFTSVVTNISSINQKLRISILYDNATLSNDFTAPLKTTISVNFYNAQGTIMDTASGTDSVQYDRPVPLFQTSILNFDKLELKATIDTKINAKHNATLKYEYVSSEATFFQLKVRAILSIISISTFIFLTKTMTKTVAQVMTLFLHVAALFFFNPLQIIFNYFPSLTFLCFDFIFKNVGLSYVYLYVNMIFFSFDKQISKYTIVSNVFLFSILFFILLAKDFNSLFESTPTIYPLEFNGRNYNVNKFISQVKVYSKSSDANSILKKTTDLALKLAFLNSTTIEESNLNSKEFTFLIVVFCLPVFFSIMYQIFNVQDVYFHRIIVFAITVAVFAIGLTNFFAIDVINNSFHGKLIRWALPLVSLSTFTLIFTFFNMEDDRNSVYEYVKANEDGNIAEMNEDGIDTIGDLADDVNNTLGLEEDDEQIKRKELAKKNESKK